MSKNIIKALHTGISVYNMEESVKWYTEVLGFSVTKDMGWVPPLKAKIVFVAKCGYEIELFEYDEPKQMPEDRKVPNLDLQTLVTKHVAFAVDNMEEFKAHIVAHNVDIAHEVRMGEDAVMFIRDINGVLIEFIQQPK